MGPKAPNAF